MTCYSVRGFKSLILRACFVGFTAPVVRLDPMEHEIIWREVCDAQGFTHDFLDDPVGEFNAAWETA